MQTATLAAASQYEPTLDDWIRAIKEDPTYILGFLTHYWPWAISVVIVVIVLWSLRGGSSSGSEAKAKNAQPSPPAGTSAAFRAAYDRSTQKSGEALRRQQELDALLQEASEEKQAFIDQISHELIEPFLRAMRSARNPGSRRTRGQIREWQGSIDHISYKIDTEGQWSFSFEQGNRYAFLPSITICKNPDGSESVNSSHVDRVAETLVRILTQHGVPLP